MAISKNIEHFMENSSWIRKMFEEGNALKKKIGEENVCDFSLGNPILEPPASFHKSLQEVVNDQTPGQHRYMPNAGYVETRKHIADILSEDGNLTITADHIIMTCGAAAGLNVIFKTLLNPGDEVIIFHHILQNIFSILIIMPERQELWKPTMILKLTLIISKRPSTTKQKPS